MKKRERTRKTDTKTDKNREMISSATQIQVDEVSQRGQVRLEEDILVKRARSGQGRSSGIDTSGTSGDQVHRKSP